MTDYIQMYESPQCPSEEREVSRLIDQLATRTLLANSILRWETNREIPPQDVVEFAKHLGYPVDVEACKEKRDEELEAFLEKYRAQYDGPTAEQRAEARAAFGPGVELVNIAGHRWVT